MPAMTESMPFFSMVRRPRVETRRLTQRRSPSSQKRWVCRLGRKRRRFLLLAWETRLPTATLLPVTSQTRLIKIPTNQLVTSMAAGFRPPKGPPLYQPAPVWATFPSTHRDRRLPGRTGLPDTVGSAFRRGAMDAPPCTGSSNQGDVQVYPLATWVLPFGRLTWNPKVVLPL